ncbi:hypothetical protein BH09MYX1_BH09MYX1_53890 [soil metagenome]
MKTHASTLLGVVTITLFGCSSAPTDGDAIASALGGRKGVDYAWARPSPSMLSANGYTFAARYLSHDTTGKTIDGGEANALIAAGLDVVLVWEDGANDVLGGYGQCAADAIEANAQAAAVGAPSDRPIYFAIDFDAGSSDMPAIAAYFDGVASVLGRGRTGVYAGYGPVKALFDGGKVSWGWQTYAWSYGSWDSRAQLRQVLNGILNDQADEDVAVADDFGQWGEPETGPYPAAPQPPTACGRLAPDQGLVGGSSLLSCDGRFRLTAQLDGNLVLYAGDVPLWASYTTARPGVVAVMQGDGNFVVYDAHTKPRFVSGTAQHFGAALYLENDGNVVIRSGTTDLWATRTGIMPASPSSCGSITADHGLSAGQSITSCDGHHRFAQQSDGNLVLYHDGTPTWGSSTSGTGSNRLVLQGDGNLVMYRGTAGNGPSDAIWSTQTSGHYGARLAVQDDGNVVLYQGQDVLWATWTEGL